MTAFGLILRLIPNKLFGLTSQVLEGVETERKVESKNSDAWGTRVQKFTSNKATRKRKEKIYKQKE